MREARQVSCLLPLRPQKEAIAFSSPGRSANAGGQAGGRAASRGEAPRDLPTELGGPVLSSVRYAVPILTFASREPRGPMDKRVGPMDKGVTDDVLEAGLEPAISSLGGRRLIH